jgi:hypothetical protein
MVLLGAATCCASPNVPKQDAAIYGWRRLEDQVAAAHEFYDYADEHFGWAETARTERERAIFLQMAAAWLEAAQQWEAGSSRERSSRYRPEVTENSRVGDRLNTAFINRTRSP